MNSFPRSAARASSEEKITLSKQELERLVQQEVRSAMKQKNNSLDELIESIQQNLDQGMNYEASIRALQTHTMAVAKRAEQAFAYIAQNPTKHVGSSNLVCSHLEENGAKDVSRLSGVSKIMERTKKEFERLHAENAVLKEAFEDIHKRTAPSPPNNISQPNEVMTGLGKLLDFKKESKDTPPPVEAPVSAKSSTEELCSPKVDSNPRRIKLEAREVPYPPLPELPFPSSLSIEAVKYNLPSRLKVDLGLIKYPSPQLSVVWSLDELDPDAPPMDTYSIYLTTEVAKGSNLFDGWQRLGERAAAPLPMFFLYTKYRPGYKICVTVVGKDKFGRYGPYSKVICAYI